MKPIVKKLMPFALVGVLSGATTAGALHYLGPQDGAADSGYFRSADSNASFVGMNTAAIGDDFVKAAKVAVPAVVAIKNYSNRPVQPSTDQDLFEYFFGQPNPGRNNRQQQAPPNMPSGLGSGVIISPDGYIISNNHVVAGASKLEVVLSNKKSYTATLVGTDPNTDIALLKIEESGLPYLNFANSDLVDVGQWVLAVGNPMGLNSTVTAGIISAKGRSISLLGQAAGAKNPIESFIQTDAAINRGNSGGALVNGNGDLIGINSAISSATGYYEGYGFAVPANLARKVVEDIKKYGIVQRGFLGINMVDLSSEPQVSDYNSKNNAKIKVSSGVMVGGVMDKSGAEDAGLKRGDIITKIDGRTVYGPTDISEIIGSKRQGDHVQVTYQRNGAENTANVTLKDQSGNVNFRSKADLSVTEKIGGEFDSLNEGFKTRYGLNSGVITRDIVEGGELSKIGITDNMIIIEVNNKPVSSQKDIEKILTGYKGNVQIKFLDEYGRMYSQGFKMP